MINNKHNHEKPFLTDIKRQEIKSMYKYLNLSMSEIGEDLGVSYVRVWQIINS